MVTKEDVEAFCNFCVSLRAMWQHYQILYQGNDAKRELLQKTANTFFHDMNALLVEHLILQICKITDPEESRGRVNLTVNFLVNKSDFSGAPEELSKLHDLSGRLHAFRAEIVEARNRLIGHLDRASVLLGEPLGGAPESDWQQFWLDLQDFLHIMHKRYVDASGHFWLNAVGYLSDAQNVVRALKESTYFQALLADKDVGSKAADVAFSSKFYEA